MKIFLAVLPVVAIAGLVVASNHAEQAFATPPAHTIAQANRPVARVNPARPIQIRVVNGGGAAIRCILSQPASAERRAAPGQSITFGSTRTQYLPPPIDFLMYPEGAQLGLSVDVLTSNNVITVVVGQQLTDGSPGSIAVHVDATGAIYLF